MLHKDVTMVGHILMAEIEKVVSYIQIAERMHVMHHILLLQEST